MSAQELLREWIKIIKSQKKYVRLGNPISPKLFISTIQEVFKSTQLEEKAMNTEVKICQT